MAKPEDWRNIVRSYRNVLSGKMEFTLYPDELISHPPAVIQDAIIQGLKEKIEGNRKHGKWILRKTFERKIPMQIAWREKSPMQDGAGTSQLVNLFGILSNDKVFSEKKKKIEQESGITIRSKESMYYFEIYKNLHGLPRKVQDASISCPYCHANTENSKFCRMCGAFPI